MTRWTKWIVVLAMLALGVMLGACRKRVDPVAAETKELPEGRPCPPPAGVLTDCESDNKTNFVEGRGGFWYSFFDFKDQGGSTLWPPAADDPNAGTGAGRFLQSEGGANGSRYAANMKGTIGQGEIVYAGMGFGLMDPPGAYDASKYGGISFWAKKGPNSTGKVRFKVSDQQTKPEGGICGEEKNCNNDHGVDLEFTEQWTLYTIPFRIMRQIPGWGHQVGGGLDKSKIWDVQWQVSDRGQPFDIWVDDVMFTGCQ